jgi:pimeloyl-ACP methyl ester carboxylesterase
MSAIALCCCTTSVALLVGWRLGKRSFTARSSSPSAAATAPGTVGRLYNYRSPGNFNALQAFESPASHTYTRFVIFVGGLTDGLLACPYVPALGEACDQEAWGFVQPRLSSSYIGYGTGSLYRDALELELLVTFLVEHRGATAVAVVGHSTGCQDAVHLLRVADARVRSLVRLVVLQAPVSDRQGGGSEWEAGAAERAQLLQRAESMIAAGKGEDILTKHHGFVPITASRYKSLLGRGGLDDMFSSDLSDAELHDRLGHLKGTRVLFVHSLADEYVDPKLDARALSRRLVFAAGPTASAILLEDARHNLLPAAAGAQPAEVFVREVVAALRECSAKA